MSYTVEQEINGRIYLYEVVSYWDKAKKQARQKRTYIGPKYSKNKTKRKPKKSELVTKNYGNIALLNYISDQIGLAQILKDVFPDKYHEILALAYYEIMEASAVYLFPYWLDEQYFQKVRKLYSSDISGLCEDLGRAQVSRIDFTKKWIEHLKPIMGIYYDITSISSYSTNIDFIEWGYNRDGEKLTQLNMVVIFCQTNSLPMLYNLYPGSIVDVTTLKNCIKYLEAFNLKDFLIVLDSGFSVKPIYWR